MAFVGCEKCGIADNRGNFESSCSRDGRRVWPCPECGRPMSRVSVTEALELVRARAEAEEWRAAAGQQRVAETSARPGLRSPSPPPATRAGRP